MRFTEPRSPPRQRGPSAFAKTNTRHYSTREEDNSSPDFNDESRRHASQLSKGRQFPILDASYDRRNPRRRSTQENSDESEPESKTVSHDLDHRNHSKNNREYIQQDSPLSTPETSGPSYEDSGKSSPDPGEVGDVDTRGQAMPWEGSLGPPDERMQSHWKQISELYDDVFSGRSCSKSHSSSDSSSSYSSSSEDDDFQLNANCMNALFTKDVGRASNIIRCDKAGPSATEVQLKMTLPLPLQLMDGFDNLVPTKREFRSAMKHLRIHGDKFTKNCEFDYNRLDEQVIDEEFAGYAMPRFYKSLFEAPTEASSDGEDELSRQVPVTSGVSKNPKGSAFVPRYNVREGQSTIQEEDKVAERVVRPDSLPSHVLVDEGNSAGSSQDSLGMMSFGTRKQKNARLLSTDILRESSSNDNAVSQKNPTMCHDVSGRNNFLESKSGGSFQPTMRQLITGRGRAKESQLNSNSEPVRGKLLLSTQAINDFVQENPSFDEDHLGTTITPTLASQGNQLHHFESRALPRKKNALSKFGASCMRSADNKEWIPAKLEQLDLVDHTYPSFDAPDDEPPETSCDIQLRLGQKVSNAAHSLIDGIPASVDYGIKSTEKDIRTVYSDLTVDEEAFGKVEYPIVHTLSLSDQSTTDNAELKIYPRTSKSEKKSTTDFQAVKTCLLESPVDIECPSMSSGDELMGRRDKDVCLATSKEIPDVTVALDANRRSQLCQTSVDFHIEPDKGPLDEMIERVEQSIPAITVDEATNRGSNLLSTTSELRSLNGVASVQIGTMEAESHQEPYPTQGTDRGGQLQDQQCRMASTQNAPDTEVEINIPMTSGVSSQSLSVDMYVAIDGPMNAVATGNPSVVQQKPLSDGDVDEKFHVVTALRQNGSRDKSCVVDSFQPSTFGDEELCTIDTPKRSHANSMKLILTEKANETENVVYDEPSTKLLDDPCEVSSPVDFSARLKSAAAARLEAMNNIPTVKLQLMRELSSRTLPRDENRCSVSSRALPRDDDQSLAEKLSIGSDSNRDYSVEHNSKAFGSSPSEMEVPESIPTLEKSSSTLPRDEDQSSVGIIGKITVCDEREEGESPETTVEETSSEIGVAKSTPSRVNQTSINNGVYVVESCLSENGEEDADEYPHASTLPSSFSPSNMETKELCVCNEEGDQDCEVFLDAADLLEIDEELEYHRKETHCEEARIHFMSEIDARSQAVEINYIGDQRNGMNDSHSLATEPPLVIAPTSYTLETSMTSGQSVLTMDTPVRAPPGRTFDSYDRSALSSMYEKKLSDSDDNFYYTDDCHDETEYHFDERQAKLAALLPASKKGKVHTTDLSLFFLPQLFVDGVTAVFLVATAWLKHLLGFQRNKRFYTSARVQGEPRFRGYGTVPDIPPTSSQRIQGNRSVHPGLQRMEQEGGTFVSFFVPDVHGSGNAHKHQPIWSVNSSSHSSKKSPSINEACSSIRQSFSRNDARSVASMKGWSAKQDLCYGGFQEE